MPNVPISKADVESLTPKMKRSKLLDSAVKSLKSPAKIPGPPRAKKLEAPATRIKTFKG